jgi:hypothetical protein
MKTKTKMITLITAIAIGFTVAGPLNAKERGDRSNKGVKDRGVKVIVNHPTPVYDDFRSRNRPIIIRDNRGKQYAYGRPNHVTKKIMKKKMRKKARKLRRMRRIAHNYDSQYDRRYEQRYEPRYVPQRTQTYYDRPVIVIPVPFLR